MIINEKPIEWYVDRMKRGNYFATLGYSDAEWFSIMGERIGDTTGLGQVLDWNFGRRLLRVLQDGKHDPNFLFCSPKCLLRRPFFDKNLNKFLRKEYLHTLVFHERDMITDDLTRDAGLYPLIEQVRVMPSVFVGNHKLKPVADILSSRFVGVSSPNLHLEPYGIEHAAETAANMAEPGTVFLVSAGMSSAMIIDWISTWVHEIFLMDCGSIWDAFVGIGGQRQWRADLYNDPVAWERWKHRNLHGDA